VAIARLAETQGAAHSSGSTTYDIAITAPASTPNGVCVVIVQMASAADQIVSATYGIVGGAVPLTERRFVPLSAEASAVYLYWAAGVTFPTGAQTIRIIKTVATANERAVICPMTVAAGQQVSVDNDTSVSNINAVANPTWAMVTTVAPTECYLGFASGAQTMTTTPATNWTQVGTAEDAGTQGRGWARRTMGTAADAVPGWIVLAEDHAGASIAFKEVPLTAPPAGLPTLVAPPPVFRR
jgi:hypothetical protein